jgi:hypothetical protein
MQHSSYIGLNSWYKLQSTSTQISGYGSTGEVFTNGSNTQINGALILVIDSNNDVIWKINTNGDNNIGGMVFAYNAEGAALELAVEYILYNGAHFPFVNISGYTSPSRPINGNSTGETLLINDWYNGLTADIDNINGNGDPNDKRIVDDFRNHLGLKWVFVYNDPTGTSPDYNNPTNTIGNLFNNPSNVWPSYPYPTS